MSKVRLSTTVDTALLSRARGLDPGATDASMVEQALLALLERHRRAEIDAAYKAAYDEHPLAEPDDWGDLVSFGDAASRP